ncbi:hypothetical protein MVES_002735 [Malassezia vespertilionis]|uniref:Exocyst complex subunit Exo70 C-terminal domain-containing protein n=1 Tax=Malassezia vespertilionis TaxID=2020962 RepID=A0A2N1J987_9BASI|nr:hypothetical protein MVES_002735 [Malassezia vespertilionis]
MMQMGRIASSTLTNAQDNDLALAEMELLEQNQKRLGNLTSRMTTILNGFDRRLVKLESSILPIHRSTQLLSKINSNIGFTQQELGRSLGHYNAVVDEEAAILRGPNARDPWPYLETIQRLITEVNAKSTNPRSAQMQSKMETLIDLGARNVAELVRAYTTAESRPIDLKMQLSQNVPLPILSNECIMSIKALLQFLSTVPAQQSQGTPFESALGFYANVRSDHIAQSIAPLADHVVKTAAKLQDPTVHAPREVFIPYRRGQAGLQEWLNGVLQLVQTEHTILTSLFDGLSWQTFMSTTFTNVVSRLLNTMHTMLPALLPRLRHELNAHRFLVLDFLGACTAVLGPNCERWTAVLQQGKQLSTDLYDAFANSCQHAYLFFPEFLRDVKVIPIQKEHDSVSVDVSDIARLGIYFLSSMGEYGDVLASLLQNTGQKNWVDADSVSNISAGGLFNEYFRDLVAAIVTALERSISPVQQPTIAAIFLLNNISYLQLEVTLTDEAPGLTSTATDPMSNFFEALAEKDRIHRTHPLARGNRGLSDTLRNEVVRQSEKDVESMIAEIFL